LGSRAHKKIVKKKIGEKGQWEGGSSTGGRRLKGTHKGDLVKECQKWSRDIQQTWGGGGVHFSSNISGERRSHGRKKKVEGGREYWSPKRGILHGDSSRGGKGTILTREVTSQSSYHAGGGSKNERELKRGHRGCCASPRMKTPPEKGNDFNEGGRMEKLHWGRERRHRPDIWKRKQEDF